MPVWHVYLVRTRDGTLYTGVAMDVARRLAEHGSGGKRGSKYLRSRGPLVVAYQAAIGSRALALKVEYGVKRLARQDKEGIVAAGLLAEDLLALLALAE